MADNEAVEVAEELTAEVASSVDSDLFTEQELYNEMEKIKDPTITKVIKTILDTSTKKVNEAITQRDSAREQAKESLNAQIDLSSQIDELEEDLETTKSKLKRAEDFIETSNLISSSSKSSVQRMNEIVELHSEYSK